MIRTQISFGAELYRAAQAEAGRLGISLAELCRRAVGQALGERGGPTDKPWMRYSGSIKNGRKDDSANANIDRVVSGSRR